jgi:acyl dehydratase
MGTFDGAAVGRWTAEREYRVEAVRTIAYATATNETDPRFLRGELAPPLFAVVPNRDVMLEAVAAAMPAGPPPGVPRLAGEQDIVFHQPLVPGRRLRLRAAPTGIHVKASGTALVVKTEIAGEARELLTELYSTVFLPRLTEGASVGAPAPDHRVAAEVRAGKPIAQVAARIDPDQTFRYAAASGDPSRFHLDAEVARSVGLPGIIVHGLCTMAFVARAVVEAVAGGEPTRLRRLAVRFSKPVLPGQALRTALWPAGRREDRALFALETRNERDEVVIQDGLAEVSG